MGPPCPTTNQPTHPPQAGREPRRAKVSSMVVSGGKVSGGKVVIRKKRKTVVKVGDKEDDK